MQLPDQSAIMADFCHVNTVRGRKVCVLTIETALEDLPMVLERLGNPIGADKIPVAIAPLNLKKVQEHLDIKPKGASAPAPTNSTADKPAPSPGAVEQTPVDSSTESAGAKGRKWDEIPLVQQCAIRCADKDFQEYMCHYFWDTCVSKPTEEYTAELVRNHLCVDSRSALKDNEMAQHYWRDLESQYQSWRADRQFRQSKHG